MSDSQNTNTGKSGVLRWINSTPGQILISIIGIAATFFVIQQGYLFLSVNKAPKIVQVVVAIIWGVGGVALLFVVANWLIEKLPKAWSKRLQPFVFVGPAIALMGWFLAFPVVRTLIASFKDALGHNWVGLGNYIFAFTDQRMLETFRNNLLWLVFGTSFSVGFGLLIDLISHNV